MPIEHIVVQGETTIGLAEKHGHFAGTLWNDPANAALKAKRADMNTLQPGDKLVIPDLRPKAVSKAVEQKHRFRRKGVPAIFRLQVFDGEKPRANQEFRLSVDGRSLTGTTDDKGVLEVSLPAQAKSGQLVIGPDKFTVLLGFGRLDPIEEATGLQKRLLNLGFLRPSEVTGHWDEATTAALRKFQGRMGLEETGVMNDATRAKLRDLYEQTGEFPPEPSR